MAPHGRCQSRITRIFGARNLGITLLRYRLPVRCLKRPLARTTPSSAPTGVGSTGRCHASRVGPHIGP